MKFEHGTRLTGAEASWIGAALDSRLPAAALAWQSSSAKEIAAGVGPDRFCALFALASRHARSVVVAFSRAELKAGGELVPGWNPERWTPLMLLRASLLLSLPDLDRDSGAHTIEEVFRFADEGELCALYACLCLLPGGERFRERAAEGCRTNMLNVFEAVACDTPFPVTYFDDIAWKQCLIKSIFVGAPLWRIFGLDRRLDFDLARMALDLADERRSAGRSVQPDLWLCLGEHSGERGLGSLQIEIESGPPVARAAAGYALARADRVDLIDGRLETETDSRVRKHLKRAREGIITQRVFGELNFFDGP